MPPELESTLKELQTEVVRANAQLHTLTKDVKYIRDTLDGVPGQDQPGLIVRTDRMEQKFKTRDWLLGLALAAVFSTVAQAIWTSTH